MVKNDETPVHQDELCRTQIKSLEFCTVILINEHYMFALHVWNNVNNVQCFGIGVTNIHHRKLKSLGHISFN
jgi:hypothetical protein